MGPVTVAEFGHHIGTYVVPSAEVLITRIAQPDDQQVCRPTGAESRPWSDPETPGHGLIPWLPVVGVVGSNPGTDNRLLRRLDSLLALNPHLSF